MRLVAKTKSLRTQTRQGALLLSARLSLRRHARGRVSPFRLDSDRGPDLDLVIRLCTEGRVEGGSEMLTGDVVAAPKEFRTTRLH